MTEFFTSDTHFGHARIIELAYRDHWTTVDDMNAGMIERWNSVVQPGDTVYHLGDFAMGQKILWPGYRAALNGRIIFCRGNHDEPLEKFEAMLKPEDSWWDWTSIERDGSLINLAHAPRFWAEERREGTQIITRAGDDIEADLYLCGHVHGQWLLQPDLPENHPPVINVGVDMWGFYPRTLEEILAVAK